MTSLMLTNARNVGEQQRIAQADAARTATLEAHRAALAKARDDVNKAEAALLALQNAAASAGRPLASDRDSALAQFAAREALPGQIEEATKTLYWCNQRYTQLLAANV
jgi:hypothetical protein